MHFVRNGGIDFVKALFELPNTTSHAFNLRMQLFGIRRDSSFVQDTLAMVTPASARA